MQLISETDGLEARVHARLSARLNGPNEAPVTVGLSGGGDSLALLALTCDWAKAHGRRVLALTVDHRLNPQSRDWTAKAGAMAHALGAQWQGLEWAEASLGTAIQERARMARHALLAQAAREAGASMLLLGHTADDVAENQWMRAEGIGVGALRPLSPSPVWPQGRGISLLRPLLSERREVLRQYLRGRGLDWIDDPANEDPRYSRIRARQSLGGQALKADAESYAESYEDETLIRDCGPLSDLGVLSFDRAELSAASARNLAVALLCASGQGVPPRGDRLMALMDKVRGQGDHVSVLAGARVEIKGDQVLIMREAGELRRRPQPPLALEVGRPVVWDGRFEVTASQKGWQILSAGGHLSHLSETDRRSVSRLAASARASVPLFYNPETEQYVLGGGFAHVRGLCGRRYRATVTSFTDETTQEGDLFDLWHGETGSTVLFSF